jgi:CDGSH-type Zn-finger protein
VKDKTEEITIEALENGPFKVSNLKSLGYCGTDIKVEGDCYICRCGQSKKAPFCDGSHKENFSGEKLVEKNIDLMVWEGKKLKTFFNPNACMHAGYCRPLKELREKEGSDQSDATAREIIKIVHACPSSALSFETVDPIDQDQESSNYQLEIIEGGEIRVSGSFEPVNFSLQERQETTKATLCRCGLSKNKPYCDAAHSKKKDFK